MTDLEIFLEKYQPSKFKQLRNSVEIRSVQNVDQEQNKVERLIKTHSLRLEVVRDGNAACMGAFEVKEVGHAG